ncbi:hypothetical protein [Nocardioides sp. MH1]|uniref:hypothetical protein n=1 Tax=Nocardioides sp. MH1 TaxID=3242490 RepID=UPI003522048B
MHDIAHAAADAARVPDYDQVLAKGRRHRARRRGIAVGAAALAVATIVGVTQVVGGGDGGAPEPAPSPDVPTGSDPTNIPYWVDGTLHVGDESIETDLASTLFVAGTTVVGSTDEEGRSEYALVDGDGLVPIVESEHAVQPAISPDGEMVVLLESTSSVEQRLSAWDVETRSEIASVEIPLDKAQPEFVVGIDRDRRVFLTDQRDSALMWVPGDDPVPLLGVSPSALGTTNWPGGLAYRRVKGGTGIGTTLGDVFGTVDDGGTFHEVGTLSRLASGVGTWSPSGKVYATYLHTDYEPPGDGKYLSLEYADGRDPTTIALPDAQFWQFVAWESDTQLLLFVPGDQPDPDAPPLVDELARCDVVALTCTLIDEVPEGAVQWAWVAGSGR